MFGYTANMPVQVLRRGETKALLVMPYAGGVLPTAARELLSVGGHLWRASCALLLTGGRDSRVHVE